MSRNSFCRQVVCGLVLAFVAVSPAWAGKRESALIMHLRVTETGALPQQDVQYRMARAYVADTPRIRTVVDLSKRTFTLVNKDKKTYTVQTFAELRRQIEVTRRQHAALSAAARESLGLIEKPVTLRATGKKEKILGYPAKEYTIVGGFSGTIWVSRAIKVPRHTRMPRDLIGAIGGPDTAGARLAEALHEIKGIPLRISLRVAVGGRTVNVTTEVIEIARGAPPPSVFTVPKGYVKVAAKAPTPAASSTPH